MTGIPTILRSEDGKIKLHEAGLELKVLFTMQELVKLQNQISYENL